MTRGLKRLDKIDRRRRSITFVVIRDNGVREIRRAVGRLEASSSVDLFGYRFRFQDGERRGNIGMIFPGGLSSQYGEDRINRVYREKGKLVLEFAVAKCPGINGCCQPWNNYSRYFVKSKGVAIFS